MLIIKRYDTFVNATCEASIYCIMITGKDDKRITYAKKSIENFVQQDYKNKHMIIINHHPQKTSVVSGGIDNVYEFHVDKHDDMTLGGLRNVALQFVPIDGYWITWDDDDYRCPSFLSMLAKLKTPSNLVAITNRLEYNMNNGASWTGTHAKGFVVFLASVDHRVYYSNKDSMEDVDIISDYRGHGYAIVLHNNPARSFVRVIHNNNTSLHVRADRSWLMKGDGYSEVYTNAAEKTYIRKVLDL